MIEVVVAIIAQMWYFVLTYFGIYNIKYFGAKIDGTNDDSQALIDAHNALPARGGTIYIPSGDCLLNNSVLFTKKVNLVGSGHNSSGNAPTRLVKNGNFNALSFQGAGSVVSHLQVDGASGNTGDGIVLLNGRINIKHVLVTKQGGNGITVGGSGVNCNGWRLNDIVSLTNGGHGVHIHDFDAGPPDVNGGVLLGLDARNNIGAGLCLENAIDNTLISAMCQYNGVGIWLKSGAKGHQFYGAYTEANTTDVLFDAGSERNYCFGYRSGVINDNIVDNGTNNYIMGRKDGVPYVKTLTKYNQLEIDDPAISGRWTFTKDTANRSLKCTLNGTSANADVSFVHGSTGVVRTVHQQLRINNGETIKGHLWKLATLDFPAIPAQSISERTITATGATVGDSAFASPGGALEAGLIWSAYVSAENTVSVRLYNATASAIDPASLSWRVDVWKH